MTNVPSSPAPGRPATARGRGRRAFSLVELIVVLSVALVLTGLLLPAMAHIKENAFRVVCSSNERQMGVGISMFDNDHNELPKSYWVDPRLGEDRAPWELMTARHPSGVAETWDGLGALFYWGYCPSADCFYCPSHRGDHPSERYAHHWVVESKATPYDGKLVYTNYHYAGHVDWKDGVPRRLEGDDLVLATDGLRTRSDVNHGNGMNVLLSDGSVHWTEQVHAVISQLPDVIDEEEDETIAEIYLGLWDLVTELR